MLTEAQELHLAVNRVRPVPYRTFDDGVAVFVMPMTYGKGRLCIGHVDDLIGFDRGFCYASIPAAFAAADAWDGAGDPHGWFKNLQTGRYRKDGDPAKEYGPEDEVPA